MRVHHQFGPIFDEFSEILILGSFPSVDSRKKQFYYAHPQNRFWKVLSILYGEKELDTIEKKIAFLKKNHIALFDVIESCEIDASKDSSIKKVKVNDIKSILSKTKIKRIYTTGKKADELYQKYCYKKTLLPSICLPSTSSANGKYTLEDLVEIYKQIIR